MRAALAARDMGTVIRIFRRWTGASQTDIGVLVGLPQPHVSDFERGIRHATSLAMFERFADGLGIPRPLLGLGKPQADNAEHTPEGDKPHEPAWRASTISSAPFVEWIAEHSTASIREIYVRLADRIQQLRRLPEPEHRHRAYLRSRVTREQLVAALTEYYATPPPGYAFYRVQVDGIALPTTVLTRSEWLEARIRLGTEAERFEYIAPSMAPNPGPQVNDHGLAAAIDRLADAEVSDTVLTNDPIYRLVQVAVDRDHLDAAVTLLSFADYVLTMDLLESELVHALADQNAMGPLGRGIGRPCRSGTPIFLRSCMP
jgi:hypothetical protein